MTTRLSIPVRLMQTSYHRSPEQYGSWSEDHDFYVGHTARIINKDTHPEYSEYYESELETGDTVYAVIANYSTGDSFGSSSRGSVEVCTINKDPKLAAQNLKAMTEGTEYSVTVTLDSGVEVKAYRPWQGYFECLDTIEIYPLLVV